MESLLNSLDDRKECFTVADQSLTISLCSVSFENYCLQLSGISSPSFMDFYSTRTHLRIMQGLQGTFIWFFKCYFSLQYPSLQNSALKSPASLASLNTCLSLLLEILLPTPWAKMCLQEKLEQSWNLFHCPFLSRITVLCCLLSNVQKMLHMFYLVLQLLTIASKIWSVSLYS